MNRPGQPQRPPNLTPQTLSGGGPGYRPQYPYGLPPRNVNVGVAGVLQPNSYVSAPGAGLAPQTQRTPSQQGQSQGFMGQRTSQTSFGFPSSGGTPGLQGHVGGPPSVSSTSDVALDPNDFPALGSTTTNNSNNASNSNNSNGASYASQAGLGPGSSSAAGSTTNQPRDFGPDDFPALGGLSQSQTQTQNSSQSQSQSQQNQTQESSSHLNGFDHRQNLLGTLTGGLQPGMINLGSNPFETDKQRRSNYTLKAGAAAWNSQSQQQPFSNAQQNGASAPPQFAGAANPNTNGLSDAQQTDPSPPGNPNSISLPPTSTSQLTPHPQTPAQQILMSPADRWGLLGLLALLKAASTTDVDLGLSSVGTDLGTMGLDISYPGSLYSTFITPWADQSAAHQVEPNWTLPSCYYDVRPPVPGPSKLEAFSDETLFFVFYSSPRDALQEIAAQELYNRTWRYHKSLRVWISKEGAQLIKHLPAPGPGAAGSIGEVGYYTYWDVEGWTRERKEMTVIYSELEEKSGGGVFPPSQTLDGSKQILAASLGGAAGQGQAQGTPAQQIQRAYQIPGL